MKQKILIISIIFSLVLSIAPLKVDAFIWHSAADYLSQNEAESTQTVQNAELGMPTAETPIIPERAAAYPPNLSEANLKNQLNNIAKETDLTKKASRQATYDESVAYVKAWRQGYKGDIVEFDKGIKTKKQIADYIASAQVTDTACSMWNIDTCIIDAFYSVVEFVGNTILSAVAWLLWLAGIMFNLSIVTFVIHMKDIISEIGAIYKTWEITRDLANMFFIFILLFIAIQTILGMGDYKKTLAKIVLVALFINFSFFFTGAMIDASNIFALQFYNGFAGTNCEDPNKTAAMNALNTADGCMSQKIVDAIKLGSIYDSSKPTKDNQPNAPKEVNVVGRPSIELGPFLIKVIFGSVLMIVVAGIFLASAILIFYRFLELILVLMFSPIAFAAMILPATKKYYSQWWDKLMTQVIFAPVYFMFLWVTMKVVSSGALQSNGSFSNGIQGDAHAIFSLLASYIIVIMMLGYSLVLAKELGASGADVATKTAKGFQGFVGRNTVGRAASRIANSQAMQGLVQKSPILGRLAQRPFDSLAQQSWGGKKGGFEQAEKDMIADREKQAKRQGPSVIMKENARKAKEAYADKEGMVQGQANAKYKEIENAATEKETAVQKDAKMKEDAINDSYEAKMSRVTPERIDAVKQDFAAKRAEIEGQKKQEIMRAMAIETDPTKTPEEQATGTKTRKDIEEKYEKAKKAIDAKEATKVGIMTRLQSSIAENKAKKLEPLRAENAAKLEEAAREREEALKAANLERESTVRPHKDAATATRLEHFRISGMSEKDAKEEARREGLTNDKEIEERAAKLVVQNPGLAKVNAKKYSDSVSSSYKGTFGKVLGGGLDFALNRTSTIAASVEIEKNVVKGMSDEAKLLKILTEKEQKKAAESPTAPTAVPTPAPTPKP